MIYQDLKFSQGAAYQYSGQEGKLWDIKLSIAEESSHADDADWNLP